MQKRKTRSARHTMWPRYVQAWQQRGTFERISGEPHHAGARIRQRRAVPGTSVVELGKARGCARNGTLRKTTPRSGTRLTGPVPVHQDAVRANQRTIHLLADDEQRAMGAHVVDVSCLPRRHRGVHEGQYRTAHCGAPTVGGGIDPELKPCVSQQAAWNAFGTS
jgi:hypothetical protein